MFKAFLQIQTRASKSEKRITVKKENSPQGLWVYASYRDYYAFKKMP